MKLRFVLVLLFFKVSSGYLPDSYFTWSDYNCINRVNVESKIIKEAYDDYLVLEENNPLINAFAECMFKEKNYMKKDGNFDLKNLKVLSTNIFKILNGTAQDMHGATDEAIVACETVKGTNVGATAVKMFNCLLGFIREYTKTTKTFLKP